MPVEPTSDADIDRVRAIRRALGPVRSRLLVLVGVVLVGVAVILSASVTGTVGFAAPLRITSIHVSGNALTDAQHRPIELVGLNRAGTEYACAQGWGVFDGPTGREVIASMRSWLINAVRIPMNEDCWLGINVSPRFSGSIYRRAVERYVRQLTAAHLVAILDLHWSAPGTTLALGQQSMPDASHSIAFWASVARTFRSNADVAFELYNEPYGMSWSCWEHGCAMPGGWRAAGMQSLVGAIRAAHAHQPIIIDGIDRSNDLSQWLSYEPSDPEHQLIAGFHTYPWTRCSARSCWDASVARVAASVPVITTEVGENNCAGGYVTGFLAWAVAHRVSALAWTWNDNEGCLSLLRGPYSTASAYGATVLHDFHHIAH